MKKGQSYVIISDASHPEHPLVKALSSKGHQSFTLIYASHWATNAGWTAEGKGLPYWIGFTKREALAIISKIPKQP